MSIKIAEYKFNSSIDTIFSKVNDGFTYNYTDIDNGDGTITRTVYANVQPSKISFSNCTGLLEIEELDISGLDRLQELFSGCINLSKVICNDWDISNIWTASTMFFNCSKLTELDLSGWDTSNVEFINSMFYGCSNLSILNISNWNLEKITNPFMVFNGCTNLTNITMNNSDYNSVNKIIAQLPTRTTLGYMYVSRNILNNVNISEAESKMWKILPLGGRVKNVYINGNNITNMITKQNKKIKGIYLGNTPLL